MGNLRQTWGLVALVVTVGCGSDDTGGDADTSAGTGTQGTSSATASTTASTTDSTSTAQTSDATSATASTTAATSTTASTTDTTSTTAMTNSGSSESSSSSTGGPGTDTDFEEIDGIVVFEAEHFTEQTNTDERQLRWYEISVESGDIPDDQIDGCVTDTPCTQDNTPLCNLYTDCDGDGLLGEGNAFTDPAEASNSTYLEVLPDRRRSDTANEEPSGGFTDTGGATAVLTYRVFFNQTGRYYAFCRARGRGPAANGLHLGLDDDWPRNELGDNSGMRWQFPNGWAFVNHRRGAAQHTGGVNIGGVAFEDSNMWIEVDAAGWHDVQVSMREDGVEIDKFMLVLDAANGPGIDELGPEETVYEEK